MIFAFSLIPIIFGTGLGVDYAGAMRLQTRLNAVTDASALSTVTASMMKKPLDAACRTAWAVFTSQATGIPGLTINPANASELTIRITDTLPNQAVYTATCSANGGVTNAPSLPASRVTEITYKAKSTNNFGSILGVNTWPIGGSGSAQAKTGSYYQIVFLVDVSNSMAIAGSSTEIAKLVNDPTVKCSFACHDPNGLMKVAATTYCNDNPLDNNCRTKGPTYCPTSNCTVMANSPTYSDRRALTKLYGYKLKIDYVKDALNSFMTQLTPKMDAQPDHYQVALYTFGSQFKTAQAPTQSSSVMKSAANDIDVETAAIYLAGYANQGWTYTSSALQSTMDSLTDVGDGSATNKRKTYVIFLSDGVEDDLGTIIYNRGTYYNYTDKCAAMQKKKNVTMFSIETTYPNVTDDGDGQYRKLVTDLPSRNGGKQIADAMKSCASSPDKYFWADDGAGISAAVDSVFQAIEADSTRLIR